MSQSPEDDPTYTHFTHRDEFLRLLATLLQVDLHHAPTSEEDEAETEVLKQLAAIVRHHLIP